MGSDGICVEQLSLSKAIQHNLRNKEFKVNIDVKNENVLVILSYFSLIITSHFDYKVVLLLY